MLWKLYYEWKFATKTVFTAKKSLDSLFQQHIIHIDMKHYSSDVPFTSTREHGYLSRSRLCIDRKLHDSSSHHTRRCHRVYLPSHQRDPHHSSYTLRTHTFLRTKTKHTVYSHSIKPPLCQNEFCELKSTQNIATQCKWGCLRVTVRNGLRLRS